MKRFILQYPDPVLNQSSLEVTDFNDGLKVLFQDMKDTLIDSGGVGLSAVQIGVLLRACVIRTSADCFLEMVNPIITEQFGDKYEREGCLSCVGLFVPKHAPDDVSINYKGLDGSDKNSSLEGIFARCAAHEAAHMNGKLIIDEIPQYKRHQTLKNWKRKQK